MTLNDFLRKLSQTPDAIEFSDTMNIIDATYDFTPTRFSNGTVTNQAGDNNGSCKIFAFALLQNLSEEQALACFGRYYRDDVLNNPEGDDHQNIRNFMVSGWFGIRFETPALALK